MKPTAIVRKHAMQQTIMNPHIHRVSPLLHLSHVAKWAKLIPVIGKIATVLLISALTKFTFAKKQYGIL